MAELTKIVEHILDPSLFHVPLDLQCILSPSV